MSIPDSRSVLIAAGLIGQCLVAAVAQAATGDLDPSFRDHGRLSPIPQANGEVRSIVATNAGGFVVGVGDLAFVRTFDGDCAFGSSYGGRFEANGTIDLSFDATRTSTVELFELARQPDGTFVGAGRRVIASNFSGRCINRSRYVVFRLGAKGRLDTGFGNRGFVELRGGAFFRFGLRGNDREGLHSLVIDPDGRIVVAGVSSVEIDGAGALGNRLVVQRLMGDGSPDAGFGAGGIYVGPAGNYWDNPRIVRTSNGGYRVTHTKSGVCSIVGLTTAGVPDAAFGDAGVAAISSPAGAAVSCYAMVQASDDSLLVAGTSGGRAFVVRQLPSGAMDPAFMADTSITETMGAITAIALSADEKILVAGNGSNGASISRLLGNGNLDGQFGEAGHTYIRLPTTAIKSPRVRTILVQADGSVVAGGGEERGDRPFLVRLLGDAGGEAPGILSFTTSADVVAESDGEAVLQVRRYGGSDGSVSVDYRTVASAEATAGADFMSTSGTVHWTDGDNSERQIAVSLISDPGLVEESERFRVLLESPQGGAGLGTRAASVRIMPDGLQ